MRLSSKIKPTLAMAAILSTIAAVAWAQNLEVKGNAWFATGGSGSAGIGTASPLAKFHVIAPGGFGGENTDGTSLAGNVPIVAQASGTVFGIFNSGGRQAGAINVEGDGGTTSSRGYIDFYDKADGVWRMSLVLNKGNAGIGVTQPAFRLDVAGEVHASGAVRTDGTAGWISQTYGGGWFMQDTSWIRTFGSKSVWTDTGLLGSNGGLTVGYSGAVPPAGGAAIAGNVNIGGTVGVGGSVGIGTTTPALKLDVQGAIGAGNSDLYFTNTGHNHSGYGNSTGYAAIENAANYGTLMILGRAGTSVGRRVDVWDYLQVNGNLQVNGQINFTGGLLVYSSNCSNTSGSLTLSSSCFDPAGFSMGNSLVGRLVAP
jgi:hypothetical protein